MVRVASDTAASQPLARPNCKAASGADRARLVRSRADMYLSFALARLLPQWSIRLTGSLCVFPLAPCSPRAASHLAQSSSCNAQSQISYVSKYRQGIRGDASKLRDLGYSACMMSDCSAWRTIYATLMRCCLLAQSTSQRGTDMALGVSPVDG